MDFENFDNDIDVKNYLIAMTNYPYSFAQGSDRKWGTSNKIEHGVFYQLMPDKRDDGGFFYWYCDKRPNHQFFKTKEMCVLYFIKYWTDWDKSGRPKNV